MPSNPRNDDLGNTWSSSTPPTGRKRKGSLDDLTVTWAKDSTSKGLNPHGRMPDDKKAVHYTELDQQRWFLEALYGPPDDGPRTRRGRRDG